MAITESESGAKNAAPNQQEEVKGPLQTASQKVVPDALSLDQKKMALEQIKQVEATQANELQLKQAEKLRNYAAWSQEIEEAKKVNAELKARGIQTSDEMPSPDKYGLSVGDIIEATKLEKDSEVKNKAMGLAETEIVDQAQQDAALEARKQQGALDAYEIEQAKIAKERQQLYDQEQKLLDDEQFALKEIDPNRFWNNKGTFEKILGAIAIGLGGVGGALTGKGGNVALDIINKSIDDDINSQKLNNEQKLAKKKNALERVRLQIDRYEALSKDASRRQEYQMMKEKIMAKQAELNQQQLQNRLVTQYLRTGTGLSPQEADQLIGGNKELQDRLVSLPNGNVALSNSSDAAKKLNNVLTDHTAAIESAKILENLATKQTGLDKINPYYRGEVNSAKEALIGKLRVPVTGPGVLTDFEYKRLRDMVGDPNAILTFPGQALNKIQFVMKTLEAARRADYKNAGINIPISKAEEARVKYLKAGWEPQKIEAYIQKKKASGESGWDD